MLLSTVFSEGSHEVKGSVDKGDDVLKARLGFFDSAICFSETFLFLRFMLLSVIRFLKMVTSEIFSV